MAYHNTYGLPTVITNCSNNYGPRQNIEKLIPKTITNVLDNKMIPVYGRGNNIRDWIYVEDHCRAILDVFYAGGVGQKYNIGGQCEISNYDLVRLIIELMGASEDLIEYVDDRPGHDLRYAIDNAKIKNTVSFSPQYTLEEGLEETIKWYNMV
jgi:dTDP-glucose 4,6-dehydratase